MQLTELSAKLSQIIRLRRFWLYVGLFVSAYILFLGMLLPAAHFLPANKSDPNSVKMGQVHGTVWQGGMGWARWQALSATQIHWDFNPWGLFRAKWEYQVDFKLDNIPVTGYVAKTLGGAWHLRDVIADLKLQDTPYITTKLNALLLGSLQGDVAIELDHVRLVDRWLQSVEGTVLLQDLQVGDLPNLGDWEGQVSQEDGKIIAALEPRGEVLRGEGLFTMSSDRQWTFVLQVKPGESADNELAGWLNLLGPSDAEGYRHIQRSGRLTE